MNYSGMTIAQLKQICREREIKGYSKLNKGELIYLINSDYANIDPNYVFAKEPTYFINKKKKRTQKQKRSASIQDMKEILLDFVDEKHIATIIVEMTTDWKTISQYKDMNFDYLIKNQKELYWALVLEKNENLKITVEQRSELWEISSKNNYRYY